MVGYTDDRNGVLLMHACVCASSACVRRSKNCYLVVVCDVEKLAILEQQSNAPDSELPSGVVNAADCASDGLAWHGEVCVIECNPGHHLPNPWLDLYHHSLVRRIADAEREVGRTVGMFKYLAANAASRAELDTGQQF